MVSLDGGGLEAYYGQIKRPICFKTAGNWQDVFPRGLVPSQNGISPPESKNPRHVCNSIRLLSKTLATFQLRVLMTSFQEKAVGIYGIVKSGKTSMTGALVASDEPFSGHSAISTLIVRMYPLARLSSLIMVDHPGMDDPNQAAQRMSEQCSSYSQRMVVLVPTDVTAAALDMMANIQSRRKKRMLVCVNCADDLIRTVMEDERLDWDQPLAEAGKLRFLDAWETKLNQSLVQLRTALSADGKADESSVPLSNAAKHLLVFEKLRKRDQIEFWVTAFSPKRKNQLSVQELRSYGVRDLAHFHLWLARDHVSNVQEVEALVRPDILKPVDKDLKLAKLSTGATSFPASLESTSAQSLLSICGPLGFSAAAPTCNIFRALSINLYGDASFEVDIYELLSAWLGSNEAIAQARFPNAVAALKATVPGSWDCAVASFAYLPPELVLWGAAELFRVRLFALWQAPGGLVARAEFVSSAAVGQEGSFPKFAFGVLASSPWQFIPLLASEQ